MQTEVKSLKEAWNLYDVLIKDPRISETDHWEVERIFRRMTSTNQVSLKQWSDAYLAAFAEVADLTLVTFNSALARITSLPAVLLQ